MPEAVLLQLVGNPRLGDAPRVEDALGREVHVADGGTVAAEPPRRADREHEVGRTKGGAARVPGGRGRGIITIAAIRH